MQATRSRISVLAIASLLCTGCGQGLRGGSPPGGASPAAATSNCFNTEETALMNQVNATRTAAGKPALPFDTRLIRAARQDARQFPATGVKDFEFGGKYGYGGTSFVGGADTGFSSAADFWVQEQRTAGTGISDPLTKDTPFVPRHIGVGNVDQSYALVLGADPGPAMSDGSCDPA